MKSFLVLLFLSLFSLPMFAGEESESETDKNWHQWRGPQADGVAPYGDPPVDWAEDKNIRWKADLPGKGNSSPIIWKDRVYVTAAVALEKSEPAPEPQEGRRRRRGVKPVKQQFAVIALDRENGNIVWQKALRETLPHEGTHRDGSWASASPITDGEHLIVHFGSNGLYCLDLDGNIVWEKDLGKMQTRRGFGEGASPALYGNYLVINWDHEGASFIVTLDKRTGKELWKYSRDEVTSWSTPLIIEVDGKPQAIINATNKVRGYDLETGNVIWESGGMTTNTIPSPVHKDGVVYVMSGFRGNALHAIKVTGAKGDITGSESILWEFDRDTPYVPSPLLYDGMLYFLKHNKGIVSCFDATSGKSYYGPERLDGIEGAYASPVGAGGRVYFVGMNGVAVVVNNSKELEVLAQNSLDDRFYSSPAIVGSEIYLRGHDYLYCIAK